MSAFDDLTLAEVDILVSGPLGGKSIGSPDVDNLKLAGGVMWLTQRRTDPNLTWEAFMQVTRMSDIREFSIEMEHESLNPPQASVNTN